MYAVSSIQPIDRALSGATTPGQSGPGSDGNERILRIPQSSSIAGTSPWDCLVLYTGYLLKVGSYPSAEVQSAYSTSPADRGDLISNLKNSRYTSYYRFHSYIFVETFYSLYLGSDSFLFLQKILSSKNMMCLIF